MRLRWLCHLGRCPGSSEVAGEYRHVVQAQFDDAAGFLCSRAEERAPERAAYRSGPRAATSVARAAQGDAIVATRRDRSAPVGSDAQRRPTAVIVRLVRHVDCRGDVLRGEVGDEVYLVDPDGGIELYRVRLPAIDAGGVVRRSGSWQLSGFGALAGDEVDRLAGRIGEQSLSQSQPHILESDMPLASYPCSTAYYE